MPKALGLTTNKGKQIVSVYLMFNFKIKLSHDQVSVQKVRSKINSPRAISVLLKYRKI